MSEFISKAEGQVEQSLNSEAQPGDSVEQKADGVVNEEVNNVADQVGVPDKFDGAIEKEVDGKVNDEIPGGN